MKFSVQLLLLALVRLGLQYCTERMSQNFQKSLQTTVHAACSLYRESVHSLYILYNIFQHICTLLNQLHHSTAIFQHIVVNQHKWYNSLTYFTAIICIISKMTHFITNMYRECTEDTLRHCTCHEPRHSAFIHEPQHYTGESRRILTDINRQPVLDMSIILDNNSIIK